VTHQFLGLDVGTQGTKGIVIDTADGTVVARAARSYDLIGGLRPGAAEQHPETWWEAVREVARELSTAPGVDPRQVAGIGVSGQQHGFVALDEAAAVIRPAKLWCDVETVDEARELDVPTGFTASKILWLKRHEPQHFARLAHVLLPHDYVNFRLTGHMCMEPGDASGTGFFDPVERRFDLAAVEAIDGELAGKLPPLIDSGEPAGELTSAAALELGLQPGILVAAGGGDNMLSAIGSGAVKPGVCVLSLGTSGTLFTYASHPVVDPAGLIAPFCDSTGGWLPLLCVMNVTGVTEEVAALFPGRGHAELTAAAATEPIGSGGLLFLPYLQGERVPDLPQATGTLLGLRPGGLTPGRLYRAALEGTSLNLAWGLDRLRALGLDFEEVRVVGGGSKNELWCRILADTLGAPVQRLREPESGALGGALQAAWACERQDDAAAQLPALVERFVEPEGEPFEPGAGVDAYAELGHRFRAEVERLHG